MVLAFQVDDWDDVLDWKHGQPWVTVYRGSKSWYTLEFNGSRYTVTNVSRRPTTIPMNRPVERSRLPRGRCVPACAGRGVH